MPDRYLIRLPWPPAKTSANAPRQGDFRGKARAAKGYKHTCAQECWAQGIRKMDGDVAYVQITFHPPSNRRYDLDNVLGRAKQGLDAVAEALGVDDSRWQEMRLTRGEKVSGGCVMVDVSAHPLEASVPVVGVVR